MNESFGAGGFDTSTTAGSGVQSETKAEGVVPVLIKQIINAPESGFKLSGMTFGMISMVAIVRSIEHSSTKITYTLEDYTGQIDGHFWLEEGDISNMPSLLLNTYARVYGSIRNQGGTKSIMIFKIEPIPSINDLTSHLLEVVNARYMAEEFSKSGDGINSNHENTAAIPNGNGAFMGGAGSTNSALDGNNSGLKGKELLIFEAIKNHKNELGVSIQELQKKFSHISANELHNIMEFMTQEGHIYTSVDADHFLPTDP